MRSVFLRGAGMALLTLAATLASFRASGQAVQLTTWTNFWKYNDTFATAPGLDGTGWEGPNYVENAADGWKDGIALFGRDDPGVYDAAGSPFFGLGLNGFNTPLLRNAGGSRATYYFRTKFMWATSPANVALFAQYVVDDGFVVYLNGVEVYRAFVPAAPTPITFDTLGQNHDPEGTRFDVPIPSDQLVQGENTIAVRVQQSSTGSSDCSFSLALRGIIPYLPVILTNSEPTDRTVLQNRSTTLRAYADASPPILFQWFFKPIGGAFGPILDATNTSYTIASMQSTDEGDYYCMVSNPLGSINTRTARVTYTEDNIPPAVSRALGSAGQDKVVVEFSEAVQGGENGTAVDPFNYSVDGAGGPLGVSTVELNPGGTSVTLTLGTPMTEGEPYTVHVENVLDLTTVNVMVATNVPFNAWVSSACSGLLMEVWNGTTGPNTAGTLTGNSIQILLDHPAYPNDPSESLRIVNSFDTDEVYGGNAHEAYGGRLRGLFIPPFSGPWKFTLRSDDAGRLLFNPNGPQASGAVQAANEAGCCGVLSVNEGDPRMSVPYNLVGGQAYYIEALWKEGTGGDYLQIAAILHGGGAIGGVTNPIPKEWFGSALPAGLLGDFSITQNPQDISTPDGFRVGFSVGTSTTIPLCYQWVRDDVDIPGAISPNYHLTAQLTDSGAKFKVRVTIPGGPTHESAVATLTVARDTVPPHVSAVVAGVGGANVTVTFDDNQVTAATAGNAANYTIDGVNPISATVGNNTNVVLVAATTLAPCVDHVLNVRNVADTSGNVIVTTNVPFTTPILLVANSDAQTWKYLYPADITGAPPSTWPQKGFDDATWISAVLPIAHEDAATMPPGWIIRTDPPDYAGSKITLYLRTHFNLPTHKATITTLQLSEVVDDSAAAYLNGVLVHLNRVAPPLNWDTQASAGSPSEAPHPVEVFSLPTDALVQGDNILAVEVHQSGTASSDIVYGAELVAFVSRCGIGLTITPVSATTARLEWPDPTYRVQSSATITGGFVTQLINSGDVVDISTGNKFFRLIKQ